MLGLFMSIARLFEREPQFSGSLAELSEDPVRLAEILLLFRMVLADGIVQPSQLTAFERICEQHFGVSRRDMPELHALLDSPKARSYEAQAFTLLGQLDMKARTTLLDDMMRIARANTNRNERDDRLIRRTASLLGLEPGSVGVEEKEQAMNDTAGKSPSFGERVRALLDQSTSLSKVANDPVLTAELLLLVRMSFADKTVEPAEADAFAAICTRLLGLNGDELTDILRYLNDFGYETTDAQAAEMLADLDEARKREILDHLAIVAKAGGEVDDRERRLFEATARRLGFA
ncbi:TerB family tellurite resistance protein [Hoeflea sp. AS60]|uniref:TerB family tellurite resistance protein n=1 Tax=Hoeflea sp. AS60 TaxID=3135780 RepID=UPI00317A0EFB